MKITVVVKHYVDNMLLEAIFAIGTIVLTEVVKFTAKEVIRHWACHTKNNSSPQQRSATQNNKTAKNITIEIENIDSEVVELEKKQEVMASYRKKTKNAPLQHWGDADAFVRSKSSSCFVIDTKTNFGGVFFDGSVLKRRYSKDIYDFSNGKNLLKAVKGQAAAVKDLK